jgi:HlyD family secretion protein
MIDYSSAARGVWIVLAGLVLGCAGRAGPVEYQGIVEHEERVLAFEVSGKIEHVRVRRGDHLKAGDVIAEVDGTLERLARDARADEARGAQAELALMEAGSRKEDIASLAAQLRAADASLALLQKSRDRAVALHETRSISQAEVDHAEAELARATNERAGLASRLTALQRGARPEELDRTRARAAAASASLALADARLERFVIRATKPDAVLDVHVEPGELAAPGVPAVTVADRANPFVEVFVAQGELAGITPGKKASVRVDALPARLDGVVEHVASHTEFTPKFVFSERERPNLVVRVRIRVDDREGRLHAGVPAFVRIER